MRCVKTVQIISMIIYIVYRCKTIQIFQVRHDPASVTLGSTDTGDLTIHIQARWVDVDCQMVLVAFGWRRGWWKMRKDRARCKIDPSKQKISFNNFDTWPSGDNMSPLHKNITRSHHESANSSLVGDLEFPPNCIPNRPYPGLWNYEVPIVSTVDQTVRRSSGSGSILPRPGERQLC